MPALPNKHKMPVYDLVPPPPPQESISEPFQSISGHRFVQQPFRGGVVTGVVCEACGKQIRGLIRSWYTCNGEYSLGRGRGGGAPI